MLKGFLDQADKGKLNDGHNVSLDGDDKLMVVDRGPSGYAYMSISIVSMGRRIYLDTRSMGLPALPRRYDEFYLPPSAFTEESD